MTVRTPRVSVLITTYDHEPFIAQALESALLQQGAFEVEFILGDDRSSDGTREAVAATIARFPGRVRTLLPERNRGGQGKRIFDDLIRLSAGRYLAVMDGDDFWTSSEKLRLQVEFLDANPDCSMCFHPAVIVDAAGRSTGTHLVPPGRRGELTMEDLMTGNPIPASAPMFRREVLDPLPEWYFGLRYGDWPLYALAAEYGRIGYLDAPLSAWRRHAGGMWSRETPERNLAHVIEFVESLDVATGSRHTAAARRFTARCHHGLAKHHGLGRPDRAAWHAAAAVRLDPRLGPTLVRDAARAARRSLTRLAPGSRA